jgi:hypothetical protein
VRVIERRSMPPLGHFSLIRFERLATASKGATHGGATHGGATQGGATQGVAA